MQSFLLTSAILISVAIAGRNGLHQKALIMRGNHDHANQRPCRSPSPSGSCSQSKDRCHPSSCCTTSSSCSMSVSWEESEVRAEIRRHRIKNPRHRLYYCPPSKSTESSTSSCKSTACPTEYTTIELIRPHVARHHKRKIRVKEEVCELSTELEIIRKKCHRAEEKCCGGKKPKYDVICKPKKCKQPCKEERKPKCHQKRKGSKKSCNKKPSPCKTGKCQQRRRY